MLIELSSDDVSNLVCALEDSNKVLDEYWMGCVGDIRNQLKERLETIHDQNFTSLGKERKVTA